MAVNYLSESGHNKYGIFEFVLDTEDDIATLPNDCAPGSSALVIDSSNVYMLNSKGEWKKL